MNWQQIIMDRYTYDSILTVASVLRFAASELELVNSSNNSSAESSSDSFADSGMGVQKSTCILTNSRGCRNKIKIRINQN